MMNDKLRAEEIRTYFGDKPFNSGDLYNLYASYEPDLKKATFRWRYKAISMSHNELISAVPASIENCDK